MLYNLRGLIRLGVLCPFHGPAASAARSAAAATTHITLHLGGLGAYLQHVLL